MPKKHKYLSIYLILFALLVSVAIGAVTVSAQGSAPATLIPATKTVAPGGAVTNTVTPTVPTATKTTAAATATSPAATTTRTATSVPVTATATVTATKATITSTVTRTPTKAATVTATRTPTKAAARRLGPSSVPGPGGTFVSAFTIQNMSGSDPAHCSYQFFDNSGASVYTSSMFTISVGGSNFTYVGSIGSLSSGQYAGVVSCDQQIAAVINTGSANSGGSYDATSNPGSTWFAPNAYSNYANYYTNFVVQNATSSPLSVTLQVIDSGGAVALTQTANNIPASSSANIDQTGVLTSGIPYSAKITSTGNIAVEANIYGNGGTVTNQLYMYQPFAGGTTTAYAPVVMNNYSGLGYFTALTVQNIGSVSTPVTVTYGTGLTNTFTIPPSASHVFFTPSSGLSSGTLTSARVNSGGQPIVALVNESNSYDRAGSYTAFQGGTTKVNAPIALKRYVNYNTSITCQNIGGSPTDITITYNNGWARTITGVVANGTALFYQPSEPTLPGPNGLPNGFNGSAVLTSSGQPFVCIVNEDQNEGAFATTVFDQLFSYEGINQ